MKIIRNFEFFQNRRNNLNRKNISNFLKNIYQFVICKLVATLKIYTLIFRFSMQPPLPLSSTCPQYNLLAHPLSDIIPPSDLFIYLFITFHFWISQQEPYTIWKFHHSPSLVPKLHRSTPHWRHIPGFGWRHATNGVKGKGKGWWGLEKRKGILDISSSALIRPTLSLETTSVISRRMFCSYISSSPPQRLFLEGGWTKKHFS